MLHALPLSLRLAAFRQFEHLSARRAGTFTGGRTARDNNSLSAAPPRRSIWVFASTIGEVNAIQPFLDALLAALDDPPLTLISDRTHYGAAYRAKYPQAHFEQSDGSMSAVEALAARRPPSLLLVAEIPSLLHDAPCRFSYATVRAAQRAAAPVVLVNGWLYGYPPPSRLDRVEHELFARDYAAGFDLALVQTESVRASLLAAGAAPQKVRVTGNIKFDAMPHADGGDARSELRAALADRMSGPVVVAGSVTETEHQRLVLDAFRRLLAQEPGALLVLAPRHPENEPRMRALRQMLEGSGLEARFRTEHSARAAVTGSVLVLDTIGELRNCYAEASVAFVGVDHNVLEPLAFGKPVFVSDGWEATYPSYPVYCQLRDAGGLQDVGPLANLGTAWCRHFESRRSNPRPLQEQRVAAVLAAARGAVERNMNALREAGVLAALAGR